MFLCNPLLQKLTDPGVTTKYLIEAPPESSSPPPVERIIERREIITSPPPPPAEVPRSVREWDVMREERIEKIIEREPSPARERKSHRSQRSRSVKSHRNRSPSPSLKSHRRSPSPSVKSRRRSPSIESIRPRHRASSQSTRREIIIDDDREESATVHGGPLALVVPERRHKSEREIKEEIRELEAERRLIKHEREGRQRGEREIIITDERPREVVEVRKDRKGRMSLVR